MRRTTGQRGVNATASGANRFRRLVDLCGLSKREAAAFLDLTEGTVGQKLIGRRGIGEDEEFALARLWQRIRSGTVDDSDPPGAIRQSIALDEVEMIVAGGDIDSVARDWERRREGDEE